MNVDVSANTTSTVYAIETTGVVVVFVSSLSNSTTSTPNVSLNCAMIKSSRCAIVTLAATFSSIEVGSGPAAMAYETPKGVDRTVPLGPAVGAMTGLVEVLGPGVREGPPVVKFAMDEGATVEFKATVGMDVGFAPKGIIEGISLTAEDGTAELDSVLPVGAKVGLCVFAIGISELLDPAVGATVDKIGASVVLLGAIAGSCVLDSGISMLLDTDVGATVIAVAGAPVDKFGASVVLLGAIAGSCVFDSGISAMLGNEVGATVTAAAGATVDEFGACVVLLDTTVGRCVPAGVFVVTLVKGVGATVRNAGEAVDDVGAAVSWRKAVGSPVKIETVDGVTVDKTGVLLDTGDG